MLSKLINSIKLRGRLLDVYPQQLIFRVGAERSRRRSVHKVSVQDKTI
ncbi:MAG: hypothetical protein U1E78_11070 [Gammaproteobacteria bacterium]